uniref:Uncharacterized protein n=1 Tax=viral metagenome TaxID=1070528 RepID=A0A6M3K769_9ZZZZ
MKNIDLGVEGQAGKNSHRLWVRIPEVHFKKLQGIASGRGETVAVILREVIRRFLKAVDSR